MKILHVVGARPNFMKVAPVMAAIEEQRFAEQILVHTGQHYDKNMSEIFFQQLGLPRPDMDLGVGSGSHAWQTAQIMTRIEDVLLRENPGLVLVYGDVNSTVAAALVCSKLLIPVGHVEAGLRSFDRTMPEEINRRLTDQVSDVLFTPSLDGNQNLKREGIESAKVHLVGNVMIDTLVRLLPLATLDGLGDTEIGRLARGNTCFGLVTLHRPSNVDHPAMLKAIISALHKIGSAIPLIFPIHPRTRQRIESSGVTLSKKGRFFLVDPIGYLEFLFLQRHAKMIITDSGGIQEESTFLGIPCLTVRENTERPVTVSLGTNILVGQDMEMLESAAKDILNGRAKKGEIPPLWDGKAGERIAHILQHIYG